MPDPVAERPDIDPGDFRPHIEKSIREMAHRFGNDLERPFGAPLNENGIRERCLRMTGKGLIDQSDRFEYLLENDIAPARHQKI